jgi:hypothetical protein
VSHSIWPEGNTEDFAGLVWTWFVSSQSHSSLIATTCINVVDVMAREPKDMLAF